MKDRSRWVCFDCRKSFSKLKEAVLRNTDERTVKCNECKGDMVDMGRFFSAPRKLDRKKWRIMQLLARYGYRFESVLQKEHIEHFITGNYKITLKQLEDNIKEEISTKSI